MYRSISGVARSYAVAFTYIYFKISFIFNCNCNYGHAIFGRVGRIAWNEVIVQLVKSKCFPVLFYRLEACSLRKYQHKSINDVINSTFRKIFNAISQEAVDLCLEMFNCLQAQQTIAICKFLNKFSVIHNALCMVFDAVAKTELESCCTDV